MKKSSKKIVSSTEAFEAALKDEKNAHYTLKLYVSGSTQQSLSAVINIKKICEEYLKGRYELEVIDLYQNPSAATSEHIIAAPTLIKKLPLPLRRVIGNLSSEEKVLVSLNLLNTEKHGG